MTKRKPSIAILNYADVRNFGDVLFPMVVAREIGARIPSAQFQFLNATGSSWAGLHSVRIDQVELRTFDAIILGGGEIVHRHDDMLRGIYARYSLECIERPTDLVFGWTTVCVAFKAWLAVGVPELTDEARHGIKYSTPTLNYISARGSKSAARLADSGAPKPVNVTPDLGWLFPRLLAGCHPPPHPTGGAPYLVVQSLGFPNVKSALAALRRISLATGLRVLLLPLTRCWDDERHLRELHQISDGEFILIEDSMADLDKLALLSRASLFLGQSMHGLIATLSHGIAGGICWPDLNDKFGELLGDSQFSHFRSSNGWEGVEGLVQTLLLSPPGLVTQRGKAAAKQLDAMFDGICDHLLSAVA